MFVAIRLIIQMVTNVHLITALTAQSDTSNFHVVQAHTLGEVGIRHSFVKGFFRNNSYNFYYNRFIFDRQRAKNKLA